MNGKMDGGRKGIVGTAIIPLFCLLAVSWPHLSLANITPARPALFENVLTPPRHHPRFPALHLSSLTFTHT